MLEFSEHIAHLKVFKKRSESDCMKLELLKKIDFGSSIAEDESDQLAGYFTETQLWQDIIEDKVDLILGDKGTGKSALFLLLNDPNFAAKITSRVHRKAAENVRGAAAFKSLVSEPPQPQRQVELLWKIYFLVLSVSFLDNDLRVRSDEFRDVISTLRSAGLYNGSIGPLDRLVFTIKAFVKKISSVEVSLSVDPMTGTPSISGKFGLTSDENLIDTTLRIDELLSKADRLIENAKVRLWILLDRLDVAFEESPALERNALRALLKVFSDFRSLNKIRLKIFLRHDLFERITEGGFREATHIKKQKELSWEKSNIVHLLALRIVSNPELCQYFNTTAYLVKTSMEAQEKIVESIIGSQPAVDEALLDKPVDRMLSNLKDGRGRYCPRDVIEFFRQCRALQVEHLEKGGNDPNGKALFEISVVKSAYARVAQEKITKVLYAEYPGERNFVEALLGSKTEYTIHELMSIWRLDEEKTEDAVRRLMDIGFFVSLGRFQAVTSARIANIYRPSFTKDSVFV